MGLQVFRLYVTAASPISARAIVNARRFMALRLPGEHVLEILDIAGHVQHAMADQVIASPTLVRVTPAPTRRIIGDLSDVVMLETSLGISSAEDLS
ncbi:MAG: circadian clock KaiB family protein [Pseudomonadota bacterium]